MKTTLVSVGLFLLQIPLLTAEPAAGRPDYVAHEWGTFTSVQAADGELLQWNPLVTSKLPTFVYDRTRPGADPRREYGAGKASMLALQRMETPVIYFYSDKSLRADVTVRFPKGIVTEWYPAARRIGPSYLRPDAALPITQTAADYLAGNPTLDLLDPDAFKDDKESVIRWSDVLIQPRDASATAKTPLPSEKSGSHYYAARDTDANVVVVDDAECHRAQPEKFLFYRGVGSFATPLHVSTSGAGSERVTLENTGQDQLSSLFVLKVANGQASVWQAAHLAPGASTTLDCDWRSSQKPLATVTESLSAALRQSLETAGLYPQEAKAMVATWRDSWLEEQGLRVLYVLPRAWTDRTLPLTILPQPAQLARVMVGRAEIISPHAEAQVREQIVRYTDPDPAVSARAVAAFRALSLGRFAEPTVRRVCEALPTPQLKDAAWRLLREAGSEEGSKSLAGL